MVSHRIAPQLFCSHCLSDDKSTLELPSCQSVQGVLDARALQRHSWIIPAAREGEGPCGAQEEREEFAPCALALEAPDLQLLLVTESHNPLK